MEEEKKKKKPALMDTLRAPSGKLEDEGAAIQKKMDERIARGEEPKGLYGPDITDAYPVNSGPQMPTGVKIARGLETAAENVGEGFKWAGEKAVEGLQAGAQAIGEGVSSAAEGVKQAHDNVLKEYPNFWVGAAPLLMGALLGDTAEGARAGSEGLFQRYKDERDAKQAYLKKKKEELSPQKGTFTWKPYEREDGSIGYMKVDSRTGEGEPVDTTVGYKRSLTKDPRTEELISVSGAQNVKLPEIANQKYTVKQQKDIQKMRESLMSDKVFSKERQTVTAGGRALALLKAGNPVSDEGIKTIFPRMFGEVGNLAAAEQERFSGSPAITRKLEKLKERYIKGTLGDADRADLLEVARVMQDYSQRQLEKTASAYLGSEAKLRGYSAREIIEPFLGGREKVRSPEKSVQVARKRAVKKGEGKPGKVRVVRAKKDGKLYVQTEDGKVFPYEDYLKQGGK